MRNKLLLIINTLVHATISSLRRRETKYYPHRFDIRENPTIKNKKTLFVTFESTFPDVREKRVFVKINSTLARSQNIRSIYEIQIQGPAKLSKHPSDTSSLEHCSSTNCRRTVVHQSRFQDLNITITVKELLQEIPFQT